MYRSDCGCACHYKPGVMHCFPCCEPDPDTKITKITQFVREGMDCPYCGAAPGQPCFDGYNLPACIAVRISHPIDGVHEERVNKAEKALNRAKTSHSAEVYAASSKSALKFVIDNPNPSMKELLSNLADYMGDSEYALAVIWNMLADGTLKFSPDRSSITLGESREARNNSAASA